MPSLVSSYRFIPFLWLARFGAPSGVYQWQKNVTKKVEDGASGILSDWDLLLRVKHENGQFIKRNRRYRTVSSSSSNLGFCIVLIRQITGVSHLPVSFVILMLCIPSRWNLPSRVDIKGTLRMQLLLSQSSKLHGRCNKFLKCNSHAYTRGLLFLVKSENFQ